MTENISPNIPLLRKAVEWVEEQDALPEIDREWWQGGYVTPPNYMADHLVRMVWNSDGTRVNNEQLNQIRAHCGTAYCVAGWVGMHADSRYTTTDVVDGIHVRYVAITELGLTDEQAGALFDGSNSATQVRRIAEKIAGEKL